MKVFGWDFRFEKRDVWAGPPWLNPHVDRWVLVVTPPPLKGSKS